jgi:hypothetical protein
MLPYAKLRKSSVSLLVPMHPLMLHCGSTHLSLRVRVMGNGMVRLKRDVFEQ